MLQSWACPPFVSSEFGGFVFLSVVFFVGFLPIASWVLHATKIIRKNMFYFCFLDDLLNVYKQ